MNKFLIGAAALAVAVPALAQIPAPVAPRAPVATPYAPNAPMPPRVGQTHTRDQVVARVRAHFERMDINRDGFVGEAEMQSMRGQHMDQRKGMKRERGAPMAMRGGGMGNPAAMFDRLDANRDGMISRDEFAAGHEMRKQKRIAMHGQHAAPGAPGAMQHDGPHGMKMRRMGGMMRGHMMKMADLDRDGRVSLNEATTSALQHFDRLDTNRDGQLTPEERRSGRQMMRQMRRTS